jgi:hypothetical protein
VVLGSGDILAQNIENNFLLPEQNVNLKNFQISNLLNCYRERIPL